MFISGAFTLSPTGSIAGHAVSLAVTFLEGKLTHLAHPALSDDLRAEPIRPSTRRMRVGGS